MTVTARELAELLMEYPDAEVVTEGCDCEGDSSALWVSPDRGKVAVIRKSPWLDGSLGMVADCYVREGYTVVEGS